MIAELESDGSEGLYLSFNFTTPDKTTYWIDGYLDEEKCKVAKEILTLLSKEKPDYEDDVVYVNIYGEEFDSEYYYCNFKVSSENKEELIELFKKHGESYE